MSTKVDHLVYPWEQMIVCIDDGVESSFVGGLRVGDIPVMDIKELLLYVQLHQPQQLIKIQFLSVRTYELT